MAITGKLISQYTWHVWPVAQQYKKRTAWKSISAIHSAIEESMEDLVIQCVPHNRCVNVPLQLIQSLSMTIKYMASNKTTLTACSGNTFHANNTGLDHLSM